MRGRLGILVVGTALMASSATAVSLVQVDRQGRRMAQSRETEEQQFFPLADLLGAINRNRTNVFEFLITRDPAKRVAFAKKIATLDEQILRAIAPLSAAHLDPDLRAELDSFPAVFERYRQVRAEVLSLSTAGEDQEASSAATGRMRDAFHAAVSTVERIYKLASSAAVATSRRAWREYARRSRFRSGAWRWLSPLPRPG